MERPSGAVLRQKILDEALATARARGVAQVTMRALARRLGISPASLYLHFRSRDELLGEVAALGFRELIAQVAPLLSQTDPVAALLDAARAQVRFGLAHPEIYRLMFADLPAESAGSPVLASRAQLFERVRDAVRRGLEAGRLREEDAGTLSFLHGASLHGFVLAAQGQGPPATGGRRTEMLLEALLEDRHAALGARKAS